ncbi:MAG TPA: L-seryl-tRNA(Sec) selenium transferase, partial [Blastocatellia bacterium]|nr:L-seryl-tRNA(Sec) selenium transferase [Blastocatellia bacterium]
CEMFACEAATVVNNCAAAVFLVLNTLAEGGEVIVSRGELIEIGGSFRLPDVIAKSGAQLKEVGTTNRTRLSDFESAINEKTRAILRSHTSNYRIVGFTERPSLSDLAELSRKHNIPLFEDLGSGAVIDLLAMGIKDEPTVQQSIKAGVSLIAFSGDKLLGGPQAGIILGQKDLVARIKKNPLMRALRLDKLIITALEATLESYVSHQALTEIPAMAKLHLSKDEIAKRARVFIKRARKVNPQIEYELIDGDSAIGGGSAPESKRDTKLISISNRQLSTTEISERLRYYQTPIITRTIEGRVLIDLRTVKPEEEEELIDALAGFP